MRKVPRYFQDSVQSIDCNLRVRWCPEVHQYSVERKMDATEAPKVTALKSLFWKRANRGIKDNGVSPAMVQAQLDRRLDAQARLRSLQDNYRILFFTPEVDGFHLRCVQYTLKSTDLWEESGKRFDGDIDKFADIISRQRTYEDNRQQDKIDRQDRDDNRHRAAEAYTHLKTRTGQRIAVR